MTDENSLSFWRDVSLCHSESREVGTKNLDLRLIDIIRFFTSFGMTTMYFYGLLQGLLRKKGN
jgi:hypothetical protein